jgi:hypothetical protein
LSTTIPELTAAMQAILDHHAAATQRPSGFVQRRSKLTGPLFVQTLVFTWWSHPAATLDDLADTAALLGCDLSPQALAARFTPAAARFLQGLLEATLQQSIAAPPVALALLRRFTAVQIADGTIISLPAALTTHWAGCGNETGPNAALKLLMDLNLLDGELRGVLCAGRVADRTAAAALAAPLPGSLQIRDLGFFDLGQFATWEEEEVFWLSRLRGQVGVYAEQGTALDLEAWLAAQGAQQGERSIRLGSEQQLRCRLLWAQVPPEVADARRAALAEDAIRRGRPVSSDAWRRAGWTLLITNTSGRQLSVEEALVLARARWEIELLFKRWKSLGAVDEWRSSKPWRVLCEVYAKLIALLLQHRLVARGCWERAERSLARATRRVAGYGPVLAGAWGHSGRVRAVLGQLVRRLARGSGITKRRREPALYQLLADPQLLAAKQQATVARLRKAQAARTVKPPAAAQAA